jgi:hypothetical protein
MQLEQPTSAHAVDALPHVSEKRASEQVQIVVSALELQISEQVHGSNTALLAQLQRLAQPHVPNQHQSIPPKATVATEGGKAAQEPPIDLLNDDPRFSSPSSSTSHTKVIPPGLECPPRDTDEPRVWTLTDDTARYLVDKI